MKACTLPACAPIETNPLRYGDVPDPERLDPGQVLVRVHACGVCRTDLHVIEGELAPRKSPVIPGHQVVGVVERVAAGGSHVQPGDRVGIPWLHQTVPAALENLKMGGTVVLGGIHMSPIPQMPYELLYHERVLRSVANNTRQDGQDFLELAAKIPIEVQIQTFPLAEANAALNALKHDAIRGAAVLTMS
jgi:D-arabinose 1-dehydrogenase-like Zn-dependent alcohol dehydrogenase